MKVGNVPILMYHDISPIDNPWCVAPLQFEVQMQWLKNNGYTAISMAALQQALLLGRELPEKSVVLTFDDGRRGVYTYAYPLLKKQGFCAALYIVPGWLEGQEVPLVERYSPLLTWEQLRELAQVGFELGSHSYSHQDLTKLSQEQLEQELSLAEASIVKHLGTKVEHFCYPYGAWNQDLAKVVALRYKTAVTTQRGFAKESGNFARQGVMRDTSLNSFKKLLQPPRLSACLIVKDEEQFLSDCLRSMQGLADEIVIVDTGSKDKTKEIAAEYTSKIFDLVWPDDFALARNESLKQATGDWILVLDADEVLAKEDHAAILEACNQWEVQGFRILTRNYSNNSTISGWQPDTDVRAKSFQGWYPSLKIRLFQRGQQFVGRMHEVIQEAGVVKTLPVIVHHYGELRMDSEKKAKYFDLAQKKVAEQPDPKAHYELGVQYKERGEYFLAEKALQQSLSLNPTAITPLLNLAVVQQKQRKFGLAVENYHRILIQKEHAEAYFGLGYCCFAQNQLPEAENFFRKAGELQPSFVEAWVNLGAVYEKLGKVDEALAVLGKALQLAPHHGRAWHNLGVACEKKGMITEACKSYSEAVAYGYHKAKERLEQIQQFLAQGEFQNT